MLRRRNWGETVILYHELLSNCCGLAPLMKAADRRNVRQCTDYIRGGACNTVLSAPPGRPEPIARLA